MGPFGSGRDDSVFAGYSGREDGFWGSGFKEAVAALPLVFEAGPDGVYFGSGHGGVGGVDKTRGFDLGEFEEIAVAGEVGDAELWEAGLAGAEEFSGAALLEIDLG